MQGQNYRGNIAYFFFGDFPGCFLNSATNAIMHAYANSADNAVIIPLINPSENIANNMIDNINRTVYPKFLTNTAKIFSSVFIFPSFCFMRLLYHKLL